MENNYTANKNCGSCEKEVPEGARFCPYCAMQLRCPKCETDIIKDAITCMACGTRVNELEKVSAKNTFEFKQTGKSKQVKAHFTDEVGKQLSDVLYGMVTGEPIEPKIKELSGPSGSNGSPASPPSHNSENTIEEAEYVEEPGNEEYVQILRKVFRKEGETLVLYEPRLKHTSKRDYYIRITMLFLYAHQLQGNYLVKRSLLTEILTQENVNDPNARTWIKSAEELSHKDGQVELRPAGVEKAQQYLKEIADPSIEQKNVKIGTQSKSKSSKTEAINNGTEEKQEGNGSNKKKSGKVGYKKALTILISEGFFKERKSLNDIKVYCADTRVWHFKSKDISSGLGRLVKNQKLKRVKNADQQFEYFE